MPASVVAVARRAGIPLQQLETLEEVLPDTDVLYVTRVQKERFQSEAEWQRVKDSYRVDHALLSRAKEDMIVMHPLPRVNGKSDFRVTDLDHSFVFPEIDPEVDFDSRRAVYFRQMRYGLFVCAIIGSRFQALKEFFSIRSGWRYCTVLWDHSKRLVCGT